MTDVSIIIPTYNRLWSLPQAIASCQQTQTSTEVIVIDDGSTDGTWDWLQQQSGIIAIQQPNLGKTWAVNRGFELAKGQYIRFLDSDDWLVPTDHDQQVQMARATSADIVVAGYQAFYESDASYRPQPWEDCDDFIAQQLGECSSSHYSAYLFRKDFLASIPHRPDFAFRDDRLLVLEAALENPHVTLFEGFPFVHRHHQQARLQASTGMRSVVTHWQQLQIYRRCLAILKQRGELTPRRAKAATQVLWPLAHWIAYTHPSEGENVAKWVYELDPAFIPPETGVLGYFYRQLGFRTTERILGMRRSLLLR